MLLYLAVFSICLLIAQIADNYKQHKIYWGFLGILVLFLSYFSGVRDLQVGIDTQIYIPSYWSESNAQNFTRFLKILEETEKDKGFLALDFVAHAFGGELWISLFLFLYSYMEWPLLLEACLQKNTSLISLTSYFSICLFSSIRQ